MLYNMTFFWDNNEVENGNGVRFVVCKLFLISETNKSTLQKQMVFTNHRI